MTIIGNRQASLRQSLAACCTAGALSLVVAGCASAVIEDSARSQMFDLSMRNQASTATRARPRNVQLVVYEPTTIRTLDGDRVVVRLPDRQMNYLDGARWSDRLPALMQVSLIDVLSRSGQFRAVSNGRDKVDADVSLSSAIQAFEVDLGTGGKAARVSLAVKVVDERTGSVLNSRLFTATAPLKANAPGDHVAAIKDAFASASIDLVGWLGELKIKPRKDKLPEALARGTIAPDAARSSIDRVSRTRPGTQSKL